MTGPTDRRALRLLDNEEILNRLRRNYYQLYKPLMQARENPDLLEEWRTAPRGSIGWRSLIFYEQALRVLEIAMRD